ncbi:MAG: endolytic transglycosylase MltG [Candidatus Portnoybacteria bacterium CG03_land_8_20_14_0_80_41_10]|uniref:Endolytic murein transglycosylase n=1 Tax=Candidatus Portnoybacteria bacterium CG03_land_8_20_14_0_80_41_10 TaxID=1974808 RepID=A0A2M7BUC7_9BACT|nr:MAG: endolytic transglycosylase MltG [Candidatus Portnoybacteria bacterium CG03_land_8_20_14_0_80_41_10]
MEIINQKKFTLFLVVVILLIFGLISFFYIRYQIITPLEADSQKQSFVIERGESLKEIATNLKEVKLIRDKFLFEYYVLYKGWGARLQAGQYELSPSFNIPQIAQKIAEGKTTSNEVTITIPEGFNLKQIDARLAKAGLIEEGELLKQPQLEGYLFPDTYYFSPTESLDGIVAKMKANFERKIGQGLKEEIANQGKSIEEIVIMASLLEKEVSKEEDRRLVSGIFWQRLEDNYPLESCATIAYILGVDKWRYTAAETKSDSPYNTYQNIGLPPGPICHPGLSAIKAAVYPQASQNYFFLSKPDGETVFSQTLEEHNQNKSKYLQ